MVSDGQLRLPLNQVDEHLQSVEIILIQLQLDKNISKHRSTEHNLTSSVPDGPDCISLASCSDEFELMMNF